MARTWAELRQLSKDDLILEYDKQAKTTTSESLAFIRDMIFQRARDEEGDRMQKMTREIRTLTWWITGLTVVNTAAVITALLLGR